MLLGLEYGSTDSKLMKRSLYPYQFSLPGIHCIDKIVMYAWIDIMSSILWNTLHCGAFSLSMLLAWTRFDKAVQMPVISCNVTVICYLRFRVAGAWDQSQYDGWLIAARQMFIILPLCSCMQIIHVRGFVSIDNVVSYISAGLIDGPIYLRTDLLKYHFVDKIPYTIVLF